MTNTINCSQFQELYTSSESKPFKFLDDDAYLSWCEHMHECDGCSEWYMGEQAKNSGIDLNSYPCVHLAYHSIFDCEVHKDAYECPDVIIVKTSDGYGVPIHDGGSSRIDINFCPWCGLDIRNKNDE